MSNRQRRECGARSDANAERGRMAVRGPRVADPREGHPRAGTRKTGWMRARSPALWGLLLLLLSPAVRASDTLLVLDVSEGMATTCPAGENSLLAHAIARVGERLDALSSDEAQVGLITFAAEAKVLQAPTADLGAVRALLASATLVPDTASLLGALATAARVLSERGTDQGGRILVFGSGGAVDAGALLALLASLHERGVSVEIELLEPGLSVGSETWGSVDARLLTSACASADPAAAGSEVEVSVRRTVARQLGIPADSLSLSTDLVEDLGVDRATAFEILARVCDEYDVRVPESGDLTRIGAIADYVASVEDDGLRPRAPSSAYVQTVFYGTNRRPQRSSDPRDLYSGERSRAGQLRYGVCEVSIPLRAHKPGSLETPFLNLEYLADERQHILLKTVEPMDKASFFRELRAKLHSGEVSDNPRADAMVFIPGFNTTFGDVARRTAQMSYDLGFSGAPIMFSWPSDGSFLGYLSDREDIEWSVPHIERFLTEILEEGSPRRLHLIAHSMGNEGLLRALTFMATRRDADAPPLFENVILAAPDFDAQIFVEQTAPRVRGISRRWTVYVSDKDGALNISSRIRSAKRLGLPVTLAPGVDTVDATGVEVTPWSVPEFHSYYATKQLVIADLIGVLQGLDPASRRLLSLMSGDLPYWSFAEIRP